MSNYDPTVAYALLSLTPALHQWSALAARGLQRLEDFDGELWVGRRDVGNGRALQGANVINELIWSG